MNKALDFTGLTVILGNSNRRFSGVTSTMLKVLPYQLSRADIRVMGRSNMADTEPCVSFLQVVLLGWQFRRANRQLVFHARRNNEMIQALLLKWMFFCPLKIVFTSTAQRKKTWITRFLMNHMQGLISTCQAAADYMPSPPDIIIPHGVEHFEVQSDAPSASLPKEVTHWIGVFGRVRKQKGIDTLVDAATRLLPKYPHWGVLIVGEVTPEEQLFKERLSDLLRKHDLDERVVFTGKVSYETLMAYFHLSSIVVALSRNEGFGLTVLEGLSAAKPVIATKAGAWPDILNKLDGSWLIEPGDSAALAGKLEILVDNSTLRHQLGLAGYELVRREYTVQREAESLLAFYQKTLNF